MYSYYARYYVMREFRQPLTSEIPRLPFRSHPLVQWRLRPTLNLEPVLFCKQKCFQPFNALKIGYWTRRGLDLRHFEFHIPRHFSEESVSHPSGRHVFMHSGTIGMSGNHDHRRGGNRYGQTGRANRKAIQGGGGGGCRGSTNTKC